MVRALKLAKAKPKKAGPKKSQTGKASRRKAVPVKPKVKKR
jgi:hypothetical protein